MATKNRISITIMPKVDLMLREVADKNKLSKSAIVEIALSEYLQKQLAKEAKELAKMDFSDLPDEEQWQEIQAETL